MSEMRGGPGSVPPEVRAEGEQAGSHSRLPLRKRFVLPAVAAVAAGAAALGIGLSGSSAGHSGESSGGHAEGAGSSLIGKFSTSEALHKLGITLGKKEVPPGTTDANAPYYLQVGTSTDGKKTAFIGEQNGTLLGIEGNVVEAAISDDPNAKGELVLAASRGISPAAMRLGYDGQPSDGDTIRVFRITKEADGKVGVTAEGDLYTFNTEKPLDSTQLPHKYVKQAGTSRIPAVVVGPTEDGKQSISVLQPVGWQDSNGQVQIGAMEEDSLEIPA